MTNRGKIIKIANAWLLTLMLAIAAVVVTVTVVNHNSFGPQRAVQDYLDALRAGDGAKALGLLNAKVPPANAAVLDGAGLAKSQAALKDVHIGDPANAPLGHKTVTVSYSIGDAQLTTDFTLSPGPRQWLFFEPWTIAPSTLPQINVTVVNASQASINGVAANMPDGKSAFAVFYPGSYSAEYRSDFFAAPAVTRNVTAPTAAIPAVVLATGPTSNLLTRVGDTIDKYLDACTKQAVLMPTGCPMSAGTDNRVVSAVKWSILQYPDVAISPYGGQWIMAPLTVKARVEYKEQNLYTGALGDVKTTEDFGFTAKLAISGNTVTVTPVVSY